MKRGSFITASQVNESAVAKKVVKDCGGSSIGGEMHGSVAGSIGSVDQGAGSHFLVHLSQVVLGDRSKKVRVSAIGEFRFQALGEGGQCVAFLVPQVDSKQEVPVILGGEVCLVEFIEDVHGHEEFVMGRDGLPQGTSERFEVEMNEKWALRQYPALFL